LKRLFIIGNGFDKAHKLKTGYDDFKRYIVGHNEFSGDVHAINIASDSRDGGIDHDSALEYVVGKIDQQSGDYSEWSDFEKTLGELEFSDEYDHLPYVTDSYSWQLTLSEEITGDIISSFDILPDIFKEWISTISMKNVCKIRKFSKLLKAAEVNFLSFNYTKVLQETYCVDDLNVLHIHGCVNTTPIFGHGENVIIDDFDPDDVDPISEAQNTAYIHNSLLKNTGLIIEDNLSTLNSFADDIDEFYFFGFSNSKVDKPYVNHLISRVDARKCKVIIIDKSKKKKREITKYLLELNPLLEILF